MSIERLQRLWSTILILFWQNLFSQISSLILLLTNTIRNRHWNIQTYTDHITEDFHHLMLCSFKVHLYILHYKKRIRFYTNDNYLLHKFHNSYKHIGFKDHICHLLFKWDQNRYSNISLYNQRSVQDMGDTYYHSNQTHPNNNHIIPSYYLQV